MNKDGTNPVDPRLGRLVAFDVRSRAYPIRTLVTGKSPRSYTWRTNIWLDQGQDGACVGFSIGHELAARPVEQAGVTNTYAKEKIYWAAQQLDDWPGGEYPGASPQYSGTSVLAGMKAAVAAGHYSEYRWAFGIDDLVLALGYAGPAVLGINWWDAMFDPDANGQLHPSGQVAGGHAILAYRVVTPRASAPDGQIWLHNSWGHDWGMDGNGWLTFNDVAKLLADDGEAAIPVGRKVVTLA